MAAKKKKSPSKRSEKPPKRAVAKPAKRAPTKGRAAARSVPRRKSAARAVAGDGEGDETREIFAAYDRDGSGSIDRAEFSRLLEALGAAPSEDELAVALGVVDANRSGKISWAEFRAWWTAR